MLIKVLELVIALIELAAAVALIGLTVWLLLIVRPDLRLRFRLKWWIRLCSATCPCQCPADHHDWDADDYEYCAELGHGKYP